MRSACCFHFTFFMLRCIVGPRVKFGSSSCRVTGVSSLNLARRPLGWRASFNQKPLRRPSDGDFLRSGAHDLEVAPLRCSEITAIRLTKAPSETASWVIN